MTHGESPGDTEQYPEATAAWSWSDCTGASDVPEDTDEEVSGGDETPTSVIAPAPDSGSSAQSTPVYTTPGQTGAPAYSQADMLRDYDSDYQADISNTALLNQVKSSHRSLIIGGVILVALLSSFVTVAGIYITSAVTGDSVIQLPQKTITVTKEVPATPPPPETVTVQPPAPTYSEVPRGNSYAPPSSTDTTAPSTSDPRTGESGTPTKPEPTDEPNPEPTDSPDPTTDPPTTQPEPTSTEDPSPGAVSAPIPAIP